MTVDNRNEKAITARIISVTILLSSGIPALAENSSYYLAGGIFSDKKNKSVAILYDRTRKKSIFVADPKMAPSATTSHSIEKNRVVFIENGKVKEVKREKFSEPPPSMAPEPENLFLEGEKYSGWGDREVSEPEEIFVPEMVEEFPSEYIEPESRPGDSDQFTDPPRDRGWIENKDNMDEELESTVNRWDNYNQNPVNEDSTDGSTEDDRPNFTPTPPPEREPVEIWKEDEPEGYNR